MTLKFFGIPGCGWDRYLSNAEVKSCTFDPEMGVTGMPVKHGVVWGVGFRPEG